MIEACRCWWLRTISFPKDERDLFYRALAIQITAGQSPKTACEMLADGFRLSEAVTRLARAAATATVEGRLAMEGAAETGYLPQEDAAILQLAERNNTLPQACEQILARSEERLSFVRAVFSPNGYYLVILLILLFMSAQAADLMASFPTQNLNIQKILAYQWSVLIQQYWPMVTVILAMYTAFVVYGRQHFLGGLRYLLLFFDTEYRYLLTLRIADLASTLYAQGITHNDVLTAIGDAFGNEVFVARSVTEAQHDLIAEGASIEDALKNNLFTNEAAGVLGALVPGGDRTLYANAYQTVAELQKTQLKRLYGRLSQTLRMLVLIAIAVLILMLAHGIYSGIALQQ